MAEITVDLYDVLEDAGLDELPEPFEPELDISLEIEVYPGTPGRYFAAPEDCYPAEPAEGEPEFSAEQVAAMALSDYERQTGLVLDGEDRKSFLHHAEAQAERLLDEAIGKAIAIFHEEPDCD